MANPSNFEDISNMNIDEIEDNVLVPKGHYIANIVGMPEQGVSSQKGTPFWAFHFKPIEAMPDVDRDKLDEAGGLVSIDLTHNFYMVDKALPMFRDFLKKACGLSNMSVQQAVAESVGKQVKINVTHRPTQRNDGTQGLRAEIAGFEPV